MHIYLALSISSLTRSIWMSLILQKNVPYVSYSPSLINHTECIKLKFLNLYPSWDKVGERTQGEGL